MVMGSWTPWSLLEASAAQHVVLKLTPQGGAEVSVAVDFPPLPPGGSLSKAVQLTDPAGLPMCTGKEYTLSVSSADHPANDVVRHFVVTPSCKFESKVIDDWNLASDDRVEDAKKEGVYLQNTTLDTAPTCVTGARLKTQIVNQSKISSPSVIVQLKDGDRVTGQTDAAFALDAGGLKNLLVTPAGAPGGLVESQSLVINDWVHKFGSHLRNHGITLKTTRSCTLTLGPAIKLAPVQTNRP